MLGSSCPLCGLRLKGKRCTPCSEKAAEWRRNRLQRSG
jgi:predicted amidophosphoribosyltransferase